MPEVAVSRQSKKYRLNHKDGKNLMPCAESNQKQKGADQNNQNSERS